VRIDKHFLGLFSSSYGKGSFMRAAPEKKRDHKKSGQRKD
jgi:hypothetical protein